MHGKGSLVLARFSVAHLSGISHAALSPCGVKEKKTVLGGKFNKEVTLT